MKNRAKNINAKNVSDVWVRAVAESDNATRIYPCFIFILIMLQKNNIRNDCDKTEGQCPHRNPIETGKEKISIDRGREIKATVLLKFLIIKYMTWLVISERFAYFPGWKATINGKDLKIYKANNAISAVNLNGEKGSITFKYEPDSFRLGKIITLTTILILIVYGLYIVYSRIKAPYTKK